MSDISKVLELSDLEYVRFVADFIDNLDPATRAHVAVAYQNLVPIISAVHEHNRQTGVGFTIEDFIEATIKRLDEPADEINERRQSWFLFSALLGRLEKVARRDSSAQATGALVWTIIVTEYPRLKVLLPQNVVWKPEEKEWFELEGSDADLIQLGVNHHIPPVFASHAIVERFAHDLNLFYWPSKSRIGYIP